MSRDNVVPLFWYRWLHVAIVVVMAFGIAMVLAPDPIRAFFGMLIYASPDAIQTRFGPAANAYIVLVHAVLGAVMFGWGVLMLLVLRGPFRRGEREGWIMIALSLLAWWLPDTVFSLYAGFWQNAVLNAAFFAMFAVPLVGSRRFFRVASSPADGG